MNQKETNKKVSKDKPHPDKYMKKYVMKQIKEMLEK